MSLRKDEFEVTRIDIPVAGLDAAQDGLTIAQLSDIHAGRGTPDGRITAAVRRVNELKPDLAVLTGDYVTTRWDDIEHVSAVLGGLVAPTIAVMGNHDHMTDTARLRRELEGEGYLVLQNENTRVHLRGADLTVLGLDDSTTHNDDVARTFDGAAPRGARLVLAHTPTSARKLPAGQGLLCLSGHTHGGQVMVPRVTERLFRVARQPYVRGLHLVRGNHLYVNRGLGFGRGGRLPRFNSEPELTVITLRRAA